MSWAAFGMGALNTLVGNLSETYGTGKKLRDDKRQEQLADHREMERQGIQARVEGAKAAGIHPLAALGFQGGPGPATIVGAQPIQSDPSPAWHPKAKEDPNIARYNKARADLAELDVIAAQKKLSDTRLAGQPGQAIGAQLPTSDANLSRGRLNPGVKVIPDEVTAGVGGLTAGTHQGITRFESKGVPGGLNLPADKLSQATEDMGLLKYWLTYQANKDRIDNYLADVFGISKINFNSNMAKQRAAEKREVDLETIRFRNKSRARHGY